MRPWSISPAFAALCLSVASAPTTVAQVPKDERLVLEVSDDQRVELALVLPDDYTRQRPYPLLLALPPGDESWAMVAAGLDRYWRDEARQRGWIVASPVATEGEPFRAGGAAWIPPLLDTLAVLWAIEGRPHIAGPSNGGRGAIHVAATMPGAFASVTALPGFADEDADLAGLAEVPVHLYVGGADGGWVERAIETRDRLVAAGNGEVSLEVLPDEGHTPASLDGGGRLFDALDEARVRERAVTAAGDALDELHAAASAADGTRYFELFAPGAVFYGTDASERWTVEQFRAYAMPYFEQGRGWTYVAIERHLFVSAGRDVVWFDERLDNASYGEVRGSGVVAKRGERWRIEQYNLAFPVRNELARDLVARTRVAQLRAVVEAEPAPRLHLPADGERTRALHPVVGVDIDRAILLEAAREELSADARLEVHGGVWLLEGTAGDQDALSAFLGRGLVRHGVVVVDGPEPLTDVQRATIERLGSVRFEPRFGAGGARTQLDEVANFLGALTGLEFWLSASVAEKLESEELDITLELPERSVRMVLDIVSSMCEDLTWEPHEEGVLFLTLDESDDPRVHYFDAGDLVRAGSGVAGEMDESGHWRELRPDELALRRRAQEELGAVLPTCAGPGAWERDWRVGLRVTNQGVVVVGNEPEVIERVEALLADLRTAVAALDAR